MQGHLIRVGPRRPAQGEFAGAADDALAETVLRAARHGLPLPPDRLSAASWSSEDGAVRVWSWSNEDAGPLLRRTASGCVVGSGYAHRPLLDVAEGLARGGGHGSRGDAVLDGVGGIWSIACLGAEGVDAVTSHAGIETWFAADGEDGSRWIGTRPLLTHLAASGSTTPTLDQLGLAGIVNTGNCFGSRTPYSGTRRLARGSWWSARPGPRTGEPVAVSERGRPVPERGSEERVGPALAAALVAAAAELPETERIRSGLTGGRDSRLVVAALVAGGHDVLATTHGWEGHHDVVVARRVAQVLGIPHRRTDPASARDGEEGTEITVDPELLLWRSAVLCEGLIGAFDATGGAGLRHRAGQYGLSGSGGEVHRGGHAGLVLDGRGAGDDRTRAERWLREQYLLPMRGLLRPEVRAAHEEQAGAWIADLHERGADAMTDHFLAHRVAQWFTGARLGTSLAVTARTPFLDDAAILATSSASVAELHSERPLRDALATIDPRLLEVPYVGSRLAGEGPAPIRKTRSGPAGFAWKTDYGEELAAVLRERMSACPVLVEDAGERHLPPGEKWTKPQARRAWHAASAGTLAMARTADPAWRAKPAHGPIAILREAPATPSSAKEERRGPGSATPRTPPSRLRDAAGATRPHLVRAIDRLGLGRPIRSLRIRWRSRRH